MLERFPMLRGGGLLPARSELDDFMSDFWRGWPRVFEGRTHPLVDLKEDEKSLVVEAEMPGMAADDFEISLVDGGLVIKGEKKKEKEEKGENYHRLERVYGSFHRIVPLPCQVDRDAITARYRDGVLTVTLPKSQTEQARTIKVEK